MARTVAIIGAGQIGYAAAFAFADRGWDVTIHSRTKPVWFDQAPYKFKTYIAGETTPSVADVVVDTIAFDADDVTRYDPDRIGRLIAISSASVYRDDAGRTLDEAAQNGFPEFDGPITEEQPTVSPGPETYSTRKVRMEDRTQELFGDRATILRPCAIFGEHSRHPREWWFVKRMLDKRSRIPLMFEGQSRFQPTDADDIGCFAVNVAEQELGGTYNVVTEDCPSVFEIGVTLAYEFECDPEFVLLDQSGIVGRTPWSVAKPFEVSGQKMIDTGYDLPST
ncbi:MAG: reductase, partial [Pseudomonadota bacterium]